MDFFFFQYIFKKVLVTKSTPEHITESMSLSRQTESNKKNPITFLREYFLYRKYRRSSILLPPPRRWRVDLLTLKNTFLCIILLSLVFYICYSSKSVIDCPRVGSAGPSPTKFTTEYCRAYDKKAVNGHLPMTVFKFPPVLDPTLDASRRCLPPRGLKFINKSIETIDFIHGETGNRR